MSDATTHLLLPYILAAQAQKHVTHNEALRTVNRGDKRGHLPAQNGATLGMSGALWRVCSSHS